MRLVFCTTDGWNAFNGINVWLLRLLPALRARGHDARVLLFPWSQPEHCTTLPLLQQAGVPVDIVYPPRGTESYVRFCLRHFRAHRPDVFIANMFTPALYAAGWLRAAGVPTVGVLHNDDEEYRAKAQLFASTPSFFQLSAVVAISRGLLRLASDGASGCIARCISYGVPLSATVAARPAHAASPLRLVYHGRLAQTQKRILDLGAALIRVCRANASLEADIYGDGPDREALATLLAQDDAQGRVRLRHRLAPTEVMSVLPAYHVAVLLSDFEGLGLSILEAMAAGLVPVCYRTPAGLPDFLEPERNGLFVTDRESGFDAAIQRLAADADLWHRLSAAARATVASSYAEDASTHAWIALCRELIEMQSTQRAIVTPRRVELPPVHPALAYEDQRYPGLARAIWRRLRFGRLS